MADLQRVPHPTPRRPARRAVASVYVALGALALTFCGSGGDGASPPVVVPVARVDVAAPALSVVVGGTLQLTATARTASGDVRTDVSPFTWTSSDANVATVSPTGLVTGRAVGTTTVRAETGGVGGTLAVTVTAVPIAQLVFAPDTATLTAGQTRVLAATPRDAAGNALGGRTVTYASGDTLVATVRADGTVTGVAAGTATITATSENVVARATVTVVRAPLPALALQRLASGLQVTFVTAPVGDARTFLVGIDGRVWILQNDRVLPEPFLDLRARVNALPNALYAIAFHPRYATNGVVFVDFVDSSQTNRIERFTVSSDPNRLDPASARPVISIVHPPPYDHYGGWLGFGPDGRLLIATGDGGPGQSANAQQLGTLLGKLLRLDVDGAAPYAIPADNPFATTVGARPEIWAYGLRNPFRDSFDRATGTLYVADVGEDDWEEVNAVSPSLAGANYGWNRLEGAYCSPFATSGCPTAGTVLPTLEYPHPGRPGTATNPHPPGCSVTGGYVYRGALMPALRGHYFYGDFCSQWVRSFRLENGAAVDQQQWFTNVGQILTFGEDGAGEPTSRRWKEASTASSLARWRRRELRAPLHGDRFVIESGGGCSVAAHPVSCERLVDRTRIVHQSGRVRRRRRSPRSAPIGTDHVQTENALPPRPRDAGGVRIVRCATGGAGSIGGTAERQPKRYE